MIMVMRADREEMKERKAPTFIVLNGVDLLNLKPSDDDDGGFI
jgi:hypothetical protein